jgi:hypothetical protein
MTEVSVLQPVPAMCDPGRKVKNGHFNGEVRPISMGISAAHVYHCAACENSHRTFLALCVTLLLSLSGFRLADPGLTDWASFRRTK